MKLKHIMATAIAVAFAVGTMSSASARLSRQPQDNLFYASNTEPLGLDPTLVNDAYSGKVNCNIYESLIRFKGVTSEIEPCLAESWTISDDGLVYTFKLRQGVKFHDGTPFNAEAVKFNYDRQLPGVATPNMAFAPMVFGDVKSIDVIDEYTVSISLNHSCTPFLRNLAMAFASPIMSPTAVKQYGNLMNNPVGTGPYKFVAWDRGQRIILTTNNDYWGPKPPVQNVIISLMKEASARVIALGNQEVDIIDGIDANMAQQIESSGDTLIKADGNNIQYMMFNCRPGSKTADVEVRRALAQAVNVPELVNSLYKGFSEPATTFLPPTMPAYDPSIKHTTYDVEQAKKTLAEKGIKEIKIITSSGSTATNSVGGQVLAEAVQSYFKAAGVDAIIEVYDWAAFKRKLANDPWDVSFIGWGCDNGDPDNHLAFISLNDPFSNQGLWLNEKYAALIEEGLHIADGPEREAVYREAERVMAEDVGVLPLYYAKNIFAQGPQIKGEYIHPSGMIYFDRISKNL